MDPTVSVHKVLCKSRKNSDKEPGNDQTGIRETKHEPRMESPNSPRQRKSSRVKSKVKGKFIISFDIKGIVPKVFALAGHTVYSSHHCDVLLRLLENVRRLRPELWRQKNRLLYQDNSVSHFVFHQGTFYLNQHDCRSPPTLLFSVSPIERPPF
jgi:hypothetical protein